MDYLLDTCVFSEFKKKVPEPKVVAWLASVDEDSTYLSSITIGEIQKGISRLPSSKRRKSLEEWLDVILPRYSNRVIAPDTEVMKKWGELMARLESKGRILPMMDSMIAATALSHDLVIVTRNESDFLGTGASLLNIWE